MRVLCDVAPVAPGKVVGEVAWFPFQGGWGAVAVVEPSVDDFGLTTLSTSGPGFYDGAGVRCVLFRRPDDPGGFPSQQPVIVADVPATTWTWAAPCTTSTPGTVYADPAGSGRFVAVPPPSSSCSSGGVTPTIILSDGPVEVARAEVVAAG